MTAFVQPSARTSAPAARFALALAPWLLFAAALVTFPYLFPSRTALTLMSFIGVNIVFALSYNMLLGQGGMLSFGHAVYFGLGGYAAIHAMVAIEHFDLPLPVFAVPIVGFAAGLLAGAVIGWPSCRRSGVPFAMISLGIGELVAAAAFMFVTVFGGEEGISGDRSVGPALFGLSLGTPSGVYWFIAFWLFVGTLAMWAFTRTPLGRLANAVRDNPDRVSFIGFDPQRVRYLVFIAAGGFGGLAGGMAAVSFEIMTPETMGTIASGAVLIMAYIGGISTFFGPMLGAALITSMQSMLSDYTGVWQLYVGLLFIVVVMFAPRGLGGVLADIAFVARRGDLGERLPGWIAGVLGGLAALAGAIVLIELFYRWREGGRVFAVLGHRLPHQDATSWAIGAALLIVGVAVLVLLARRGSRAPSDGKGTTS